MQLVAEKTTPDLAGLVSGMKTTAETTPPNPVSRETEFVQRAAWKQGVLGALNVIAVVLAVRAILLVAVVGAFYLTVIAIDRPDPWRMAALAIYCVVTVIPVVWLSSRR
jgi:hypothetical protein